MLDSRVDISIITISTNEGKELEKSIISVLSGCDGVEFEYFVINNASTDNTESLLKSNSKIIPITNEKKLGFATNNNLAMQRARGRYLLLLNPDTILEKNTIPEMIKYMDANPDIGASSCKLVNPDGSTQYSARKFPTLPVVLLRWMKIDRIFPGCRLIKSYLMSDWDHCTERDVDWNLGAFLMLRHEVLKQIGYLDTQFDPLYYEDIDLCYRFLKNKWRVTYYPNVKILHYYDRESAHSLLNKMAIIHFRNFIRFYIKHRRGVR